MTPLRKMRELVEPTALSEELDDEQIRTRFARAAWTTIVEPGDADGGSVRELVGSYRSLRMLVSDVRLNEWMDATHGEIDAKRMRRALERWRPRIETASFERALLQGARWKQHLLTPEDELWPKQLNDLGAHAPAALWVRGDAGLLRSCQSSIALVGARASTAYGEQVAAELAEGASNRDMVVVSGGAYGIDAVAHRVTLLSGGTTVSVLAGGLDRWYPAAHTDLFERIERDGVIIAEAPSGVTPSRWRFLQRNRIIAALAAGTIVVEASQRSGAINTAGHAATLGKPLGAVPGPVTSGTSAGCHRIMREYTAEPVENADDLARLVTGRDERPVLSSAIGPLETRILDALSNRRPRTVDEICALAGLRTDEAFEGIGMLELAGAIHSKGSGYVKAC